MRKLTSCDKLYAYQTCADHHSSLVVMQAVFAACKLTTCSYFQDAEFQEMIAKSSEVNRKLLYASIRWVVCGMLCYQLLETSATQSSCQQELQAM